MENVDKVIEILCERIYVQREEISNEDLCNLTKSLADLVIAKSHVMTVQPPICKKREENKKNLIETIKKEQEELIVEVLGPEGAEKVLTVCKEAGLKWRNSNKIIEPKKDANNEDIFYFVLPHYIFIGQKYISVSRKCDDYQKIDYIDLLERMEAYESQVPGNFAKCLGRKGKNGID